MSRTVIAVQARAGSTRLPGKMSREFYKGKTILRLILEQLLTQFSTDEIVLATSQASENSALIRDAEALGISYHRGSENDVLGRVADAVRGKEVNGVVRVCADNPFLRADLVTQLTTEFHRSPCDYASFRLPDGTPTIMSHVGLFAEVVAKKTLLALDASATLPRHREHLTSGILDCREDYACRFLPVPACVANQEGIRMTVDTDVDFDVCRQLYSDVVVEYGSNFSVEQLMLVTRANTKLHSLMAQEIAANEKR